MAQEPSWRTVLASGGNWNEGEARAAVAALVASGLTVRAFAGRHGIKAARLARWRDRLACAAAPISFAPVHVREQACDVVTQASVRVQLGAICVEVIEPERVSASWVALLVQELSS
jgi:transposase-like protein